MKVIKRNDPQYKEILDEARNRKVLGRGVRDLASCGILPPTPSPQWVESSPEMPIAASKSVHKRLLAQKGSTAKGLMLSVGLPPSVNSMYANTPDGRVLLKSVRKYKRETKTLIINTALYLKFAYNGERLSLTLRLFFPNKRRSDISNRVKCIEDCLASALGFDDKMVDVLHVERAGISTDNPRCEITLLKLESE